MMNAGKNKVEVWADVGGTFTDCFVVTAGLRRSSKLLSSGRVRFRVLDVSNNRVVVDEALDDVAGFWCGATAHFISQASDDARPVDPISSSGAHSPHTARITGHDRASRTLELDPAPAGRLSAGDTIELDARLEAPVLAARRLLGVPLSQPLPAIDMRLGTTRGTNALLTRSGAEVALVTTAGFGDLLEIGEQTRPELFELTIRKPPPLTQRVIEAQERLSADGAVLQRLDEAALLGELRRVRAAGATSLAVCLLHSHVNDIHERRIGELAEPLGFENISLSSQVAPLIKLVSRAETTVLDAYLNPILSAYLARIAEQLGTAAGGRLRMMTSGGNLAGQDRCGLQRSGGNRAGYGRHQHRCQPVRRTRRPAV
jgi:5-oxoprolinase (ATP-hydrolysing)